MRHTRRNFLLFCAAALVAAASSSKATAASLAFGPALVLVENITPGANEVDVFGGGETTFTVYNRGDAPQWYRLGVEKPGDVKPYWEHGYDPLPDLGWCRLDKNEIEVPGNSTGKVRLFVKIPLKDALFNRKFMLFVTCAPGRASTPGVGLQVAARVQLETANNLKSDGAGAGAIALIPTIVSSGAAPGAELDHDLRVRNNTDAERTYEVKRLIDVEPDPEKHERYFSPGQTPVLKDTWLKTEPTFKVKPGETKSLNIIQKTPADVTPGHKHEELLFIKDDQGRMNFLRVRTEVTAPATIKTP